MKTLQKLILLSRIGMLPLSLSVPIIGALSLHQTLSLVDFIALAGIGISAHFFGFVLNDLMDYQLDKASPYRQKSPLITGEVKLWQAWIFVLIQVPIAVLLYIVVLEGHAVGLLILGISVGLSVIYNLFSKWRWLPRIFAEVALALSVTLLGLSGALAYQQILPADALLYCGTLGLVLLLVNSVPSGLKDIQYDSEFGARSFVIATGTSVAPDGTLTLSPLLKWYMVGLQIIIGCLTILLGFVYQLGILAWLVMLLLQVYASLHTLRLLNLRHVSEFKEVFLFLGGFYNYLALVIHIWGYLPLLIQIVLTLIILHLLSIPFRRAWSVYRGRHKRIIQS